MQELPLKVDHNAGTITKLFTNLTYPLDSQSEFQSSCQDSFQASSIMQVDRKQNTGYDSEAKQQIKKLQALKETIIGSYLMGTDVKYLCKPIRVSKQPWSITFKLGIPLLKSNEKIKDIFEFTEILQYFDFIYCICGMLIQLVQHRIFHTYINTRNIIYTGPSSGHELLRFQLIDYSDAFFFQDLEEGKFNKQSRLQLLFLQLKKQQMTNPKSLQKYLIRQMVEKGFSLIKQVSTKFVISKEQNVWLTKLMSMLQQELISYVEKSNNNKTQRNNFAFSQKFLSASSPTYEQGSSSSMNDKFPYPIKENQYRQYPHSLIGLITFTNGKQTIKKATGVLVSSNLVITAAHTFLNIGKRCSFIYKRLAQHPLKNNKIEQIQKQFAASCEYSIRFHLEVPGQYRRTQGVEVVDWRYPAKYNGTNNSRQYNYVILKLAKPACAQGTRFMKPTVFKCEKCIQKLNQQQPLQVYGYNTKQGQQQDCFNKSIYQYGLGRQQCIQKVDFLKKMIIYEMALGSGYIGSPLILNNFYIGFHVGKKQDNSSNNNGIIFTEQVLLDLTRYALEMGQNPFSREAKPICPHIDRQYDNRNEPIFDRLDFTREGMEDIQEVGHEKYPQLKHIYLSDNEFTWIDLTKNVGLLTLCIAQNLLMSIDATVNKNLRYLDISNNQISAIDVSQNIQLRTLLIAKNKLSKIDVSRNSQLRKLMLQGNKLAQIDLSQNRQLKILSLAKNQLRQINISANTQITEIDLNNNQLQQIDLSANTQITQLGLRNNQLQQMNLSANTQITQLGLRNNQLKQIDLSANTQITEIDLNNNQLQQINLSANTQIALLELSNNQLQQIKLSTNSQITQLNLCNNQLQQLNLSANTQLTQLYLINNQLRQINLSANTQLTQLYLRNNKLQQINLSANTQIAQLDLSANALLQIDLSENHQLKELFLNANRLKQLKFHFNSEMMKQTSIGDFCRLNFQNSPFCQVQIIYNTEDEKIFIEFLNKLKEYTVKGNQQCSYTWKYTANGNTIYNNSPPLELSSHSDESFSDNSQQSLLVTDGIKYQQQSQLLEIKLEILIAKYLMSTDAKYLCKPIKIDEESKQITYKLGVPFFIPSQMKVIKTFEIKQKRQYLDLVFCVCEMLKELVEFGIYHQDIKLRNIIYAGSTQQYEYHKFMLIDYSNAYLFLKAQQQSNSTLFDISKRAFEQNKKQSPFSLGQAQPLICDMVQQAKMTLLQAMDIFPKQQMHQVTQIVENLMANTKLMLLSLTNIGAMEDALIQYESLKQALLSLIYKYQQDISLQEEPILQNSISCLLNSQSKNKQIQLDAKQITSTDYVANDEQQYDGPPLYRLDYTREDLEDIQEVGHEQYPNLKYLYLSENRFTKIDLTKNVGLQIFHITQNLLRSIDVRINKKLFYLDISSNQISSIDLSQNLQLRTLFIANNRLQKIDVSQNSQLVRLRLQGNKLTQIDLSQNRLLKVLSLANNQISKLDLSSNQHLKELDLNHNLIETIGLKHNKELTSLFISNNELKQIDLTNNNCITLLNLEFNDLSSIDLSHNLELQKLSLRNNKNLSKIDLSKHSKLIEAYLCINEEQIIVDLKQQNAVAKRKNEPQIIFDFSITSFNAYLAIQQQNQRYRQYQLFRFREDKQQRGIQQIMVNQYLKVLYCQNSGLKYINFPTHSQLSELYLRNNSLQGINLSSCSQLTRLFLKKNKLTKLDLMKCGKIQQVYLGKNQLQQIDLRANTQITYLNLLSNQLQQIDLRVNTQITYLNLSDNKLQQISLSSNTQITKLDLSSNQLKQIYLRTNTQITYLSLSENQLQQTSLSTNTQITDLNISGNQLQQINLSANTQITDLNLSRNQLQQIDLSSNTQITYLNLSENRLQQIRLRANTQITDLNLSNNQLYYINLQANTLITQLDLSNNQLQQINLEANTQITQLNLSYNRLMQINLNANTQVVQLDLSNNRLQQINLSANTQITKLYLSNNKFSLIDLSAIHKLQRLQLTRNQLQKVRFHFNSEMKQSLIGKCQLHSQNVPECQIQITYNAKDEDKFMKFQQSLKEDTFKHQKSNILNGYQFCKYICNYEAKESTMN